MKEIRYRVYEMCGIHASPIETDECGHQCIWMHPLNDKPHLIARYRVGPSEDAGRAQLSLSLHEYDESGSIASEPAVLIESDLNWASQAPGFQEIENDLICLVWHAASELHQADNPERYQHMRERATA